MGYDIGADIRNDSGPSFQTERGARIFSSIFLALPVGALLIFIFWLFPKPNFLWVPIDEFCVDIYNSNPNSFVLTTDSCSSSSFSSEPEFSIFFFWALYSLISYFLILLPYDIIKNKRIQKLDKQIALSQKRQFENSEAFTKSIDSHFLNLIKKDKDFAIKEYITFLYENRNNDSYQRSFYWKQNRPDLYLGLLISKKDLLYYYNKNYKIPNNNISSLFSENHTFDSLQQIEWFNSLSFHEQKLIPLEIWKEKNKSLLHKKTVPTIYQFEGQSKYLGYPDFEFNSVEFNNLSQVKPWLYLMYQPIPVFKGSHLFNKNHFMNDDMRGQLNYILNSMRTIEGLKADSLIANSTYLANKEKLERQFYLICTRLNIDPESINLEQLDTEPMYYLHDVYKYNFNLIEDYLSENPIYDWKNIIKNTDYFNRAINYLKTCKSWNEVDSLKNIRNSGWEWLNHSSFLDLPNTVTQFYLSKYKSFTQEKERFENLFLDIIYSR